MKTNEFTKPITASQLNENMYKKFGVKVNFDKYDRSQLENYRNLLRTKISQVETASNFNDLLANESYQKDKQLVNLLNTKIKEMLGESKAKEGNAFGKAVRDAKADGVKKGEKIKVGGKTYPVKEAAKPDFLDMDKDGDKKEPMKKAVADKKKKPFAKKDESVEEGSYDLRSAVLSVLQDIYNGAQEGEDMIDYVADKLGDYFQDVKRSKDKTLRQAYQFMRQQGGDAEGDPQMMAQVAKQAIDMLSQQGVAEGWDDMLAANKKKAAEKGTGKFDKKKTSTGTVYTRKSNTFTDGGDDKDVKKAKKKVKESFQYVREDEEAKAKSITAGSDMVNDFTSWMTRVGQYQTKSMIELADAIRANFGAEQSEQFKASVAPALETALNTLTQCREEISNAVSVLSGEAPAMDQMGGDMDAGMDDMNAGSEEIPGSEDEMNMDMGTDEFGASDAAAGGAEEAGRMRRESRQTFARKLSEAHSLLKTLSK